MRDRYVFADEAGNFDFSRNPGATKYFVLTTVTMNSCDCGAELAALRRELAWRGQHLDAVFHATEDPQAIRDEVFELIARSDLRVDTIVLEKSKAQPHLRDETTLYKMAWYLHFKFVAPQIATPADRMLVAPASIGTKKKRRAFLSAVEDVVDQVAPCHSYRVAFWPMQSDPCLQIADYCTWAMQRKWERGDARSFDLIKHLVHTDFDVWARGTRHHY